MLFDSLPVQLDVAARQTRVELRDLRPNPTKHRFGVIVFKGGRLEACIYPLRNLDSVLWFLETTKRETRRFVTDRRRIRELHALIMKTRYFLGLTTERRLQYLRRKGFFANINTIQDTLTGPERRALRRYEEILGGC